MPAWSRSPASPLIEAQDAALARALARAPQAEWGLAHQGARVMLTRDQASGWLVRRAGRHLVALGLPLGTPRLPDLVAAAASQGRWPLLYKCGATSAWRARRAGWQVLRLGEEAILDLPGWTPDRPACRQLRRKLRATERSGLQVGAATTLPLEAMAALSRDWVRRSGGERGFSMGRFDPALLRHQRVLLAWSGGTLSGFASFHVQAGEWTLDIMRLGQGAPDGTMHRLVAEAAVLARSEGVLRLGLAAIPDCAALPGWARRLGIGDPGLAQFKRAFGPRLVPRFAAAPGPLSLALGLAAVAWAIRHPGPLPQQTPMGRPRLALGRRLRAAHFGFEPAPVACDARPAQSHPAARLLRVPAPRGPTHD